MFNIRFYGCRTGTMKRFFTFQRPPPGYMFKRPIVPSDLEYPEFLQEIKKNKYDCENEKWVVQEDLKLYEHKIMDENIEKNNNSRKD
tara:strand:- start:378 stop:638 length:261 start_codon:yes stop_codon:yes gene_type:complete